MLSSTDKVGLSFLHICLSSVSLLTKWYLCNQRGSIISGCVAVTMSANSKLSVSQSACDGYVTLVWFCDTAGATCRESLQSRRVWLLWTSSLGRWLLWYRPTSDSTVTLSYIKRMLIPQAVSLILPATSSWLHLFFCVHCSRPSIRVLPGLPVFPSNSLLTRAMHLNHWSLSKSVHHKPGSASRYCLWNSHCKSILTTSHEKIPQSLSIVNGSHSLFGAPVARLSKNFMTNLRKTYEKSNLQKA